MIKFRPNVVEMPRGMKAAAITAATVRPPSVRALNAKHGVFRIKQLYTDVLQIRPDWKHLSDEFVLFFPEGETLEQVLEDYRKDPDVIYAVPVSIVRAYATTPNDPYFGQQYGLLNIKAPEAWDRTTGASSTLIAVLDTGINYNHEDLTGRLDLADGKDYVHEDNDPWDDNTYNDMYHGTTVSGVIAAATNNAKGVAGTDWQAKILPIKVLDWQGNGYMYDILQGLEWAIAKNADVINMSFGQYTNDASLESKCLEAYNNGIILVAAVGNGNVDWPSYPACYSTVLGVAAVDQSDVRAYWGGIDPVTGQPQASNYGSWVDVSAPGNLIWTTHKGNNYTRSSGTSLACPFVAGLAGLVKAANPGLTTAQILDRIKSTTDDIDALNPTFAGKLGTGRINAYRAVSGVVARITSPAAGAYVKGMVDIYGSAAGWGFSSYTLEAYRGGILETTIQTSVTSVEGGKLGSWDTSGKNGEYSLKLTVISAGPTPEVTENVVYVDNTTPEANITYPTAGANVERAIEIRGTAKDQYLDNYLLEYGAGTSPSTFYEIVKRYVSVDSGILGTWETAGLDGVYTLRLIATDKIGATASQTLQVNIIGVTPTKEVEPQPGLPLTYVLPNPFNLQVTQEATFNYVLSGNFNTRIYLFDLTGNLIWQKSYLAGEDGGKSGLNTPGWNGRDLFGTQVANGVYFYQVVADNRVIARGKIIILN